MAGIPIGPRADPDRRRSNTLAPTSPALLRISVVLTSVGPVIVLAGELDVATAPAVNTVCFETFEAHHRPHVVVDVARLSFYDCAGLNAFLHVHNWARAGGGWVRLCRTDRRLHRVLGMTGLAATLHCYPTAADAFADVERKASHRRAPELS